MEVRYYLSKQMPLSLMYVLNNFLDNFVMFSPPIHLQYIYIYICTSVY